MKRIVITITNNISYDQRMLRIADSLSKRYNVTIVGTSTRNPPDLKIYPFETHRIRTFFQTGMLFYAEFNLRLLRYFISNKMDAIYSVDLDTILPAIFYTRFRRKVKHIFDAHEYFTELPELENRNFVKWVWKQIGKYSVPKSNLRFSVNNVLSNELSKLYKVSFQSIRNITNQDSVRNSDKDESMIVYQGALNVGRGLEEMILVMKQFPNHIFYVIGGGPERKKLEKIKLEKSIDNVEFLGKLEPEDLAKYTAKSYLGINLLEDSSKNYYYSLANKFFDYTSNLVPSLNMDFPAYKTLNNAYEVSMLVPDLQEETLKNALNKLLFEKEYYNVLRDNCLIARKEWTWEKEEEILLNLTQSHIF